MHIQRRNLLLLNLVGGVAVLGSYAALLSSRPNAGALLWGDVPETWRPLYTVSMLGATAGYFMVAQFLFFRVDPATARVGRFSYRALHGIFALILLPSALWMPLTFAYVDAPSGGLFLGIRVVLALVGVGSACLTAALVSLRDHGPRGSWRVALLGSGLFFFQTGVLDALVWTHFF